MYTHDNLDNKSFKGNGETAVTYENLVFMGCFHVAFMIVILGFLN